MTHIKNDQQLAYYMQGFFEISGTTDLSEKQARLLVSKILRMETKGEVAKNALIMLGLDDNLEFTKDLKEAGANISEYLNSVFQHDIDPSYAGDQNKFQEIHDGVKPPRPQGPNGLTVRC
jgi:hypothetical protein